MSSLRARLLVGTAAATAVLFAVSGLVLYFAVRSSLLAEFDAALATQARAIASMVEWDGQKMRIEQDATNLPEFQAGRHAAFFELRSKVGDVALRSASLAENNLPSISVVVDNPVWQSLSLPNGRTGRAIALAFEPNREGDDQAASAPPASPVTLVLARDVSEIIRSLTKLRALLIGVGGAATLAAVGLMAFVIGTGLRPLGNLAAGIAAIGDKNLSERIALHDTPAELLPVVDRLNDMLNRVEGAVARERSFSADVAHELRTPLAGLETTLEVCALRPREPAEYQSVVRRCLETTRATRGMVETLLHLSRADARQIRVSPALIEIEPILRQCWTKYQAIAATRGLRVTWNIQPHCTLKTDEAELSLVLRNLIENAVTYANTNGDIEIAVRRDPNHIAIEIHNTGCTLSDEQASHVFDRFWRADESRCDTGTHSGLGLALCRRIVELLGGSITAESQAGNFVVRLRFPI